MGMVVNHNIPALISYNAVSRTNNALQKSIQKLSTGLRINSAADDAAGLAISEKMRAQIRGLDRAVANSQDGISMIQTAEGALNETHSILQRMRELSVQAANDTLTQQDRGYIQLEIDQLREEITRIGNTTQFNKKKLLNGDAAVLWSSDNLNTKAIVNGGLRRIDQFGQKNAVEGNYNISIKAEPGQAEVKKSDIFKIKHKDVVYNKSLDTLNGIKDVSVNNVPAGAYTIENAKVDANSAVALSGRYNVKDMKLSTASITAAKTVTAAGGGTAKVTVAGQEIEVTLANNATENAVATAIATALNSEQAQEKFAKAGFTLTAKATAAKVDIEMTRTDGEKAPEQADISWADGDVVFTGGAGGATVGAGTPPHSNTVISADQFETKMVEGKVQTATALKKNGSVLFEVTNVDKNNDAITVRATVTTMGLDGTTETKTVNDIVLKGGADAKKLGEDLGLGEAEGFTLGLKKGASGVFSKGSKFVYNVSLGEDSTGAKPDTSIKIAGTQNEKWGDNWSEKSKGVTRAPMSYGLLTDKVKGKDLQFKNYYLNEKTGEVMEGTVNLSLTDKFKKAGAADSATEMKAGIVASFNAAYVGEVATSDVKLRDLDKFWNSEGVFMLKDPKTITITQGDGKQTSVTLYGYDTLNDVAKKLNDAIANGLGQGKYVDQADKFVTYVSTPSNNSESVKGTFLIRSVVPGASGTISLAGDEGVINAFSLNVIQDAKESTYTVSVKDAHNGSVVASDVRISGNKLIGVVNPNIDVEFDAMAGVSATWNNLRKGFVYTTSNDYSTVLHLADNTTVFQIGANEGEDMGINIGDMRAHALGLNEVLVTDRESAARSITVIDNALDKVSTQRAKLGAYQNRLEHTINNLTVAGENLTAAESRIRDTDMAKEMMNFTKLNIMLQAGNAMLAQANQLPQNVLSLIR